MSAKVILDSVERGVQKLIGENRRLKGENERLSTRTQRLKEDNERLTDELNEAQKRLTVKDLAQGFGDTAKVDRLIREVDICIGLLNG